MSTPKLTLPTDRARQTRNPNFASRLFSVPKDLTESLRDLARSQQVPLSAVVLTAFQVLLLRYTSQEEMIIGCSLRTAEAPLTSFDFLVRGDLSGDPMFRHVLERVNSELQTGLEHQQFALEDMVRVLSGDKDTASSMFQVSFSYQTSYQTVPPNVSHAFSPIANMPVDLHLHVDESREELNLKLFYNSDLFEDRSIDRTVGHLQTLLAGIAENSNQHLSELPILTADEKRQILIDWNQTACEYPRDKCLHQLIEKQAEQFPERPAAVSKHEQLTIANSMPGPTNWRTTLEVAA